MAKNSERDDLVHILTETLTMEGYEVDSEIEREVVRLAKLIIAKNNYAEEESEEEDEELFGLELEELPEDLEWPDDEEL